MKMTTVDMEIKVNMIFHNQVKKKDQTRLIMFISILIIKYQMETSKIKILDVGPLQKCQIFLECKVCNRRLVTGKV